MKTLAFVLGTLVWTLTVMSTAAYVGNWGGHDQGFAFAIVAFGLWVSVASLCKAVKKTDPSGG